jgi:hypothetical protein
MADIEMSVKDEALINCQIEIDGRAFRLGHKREAAGHATLYLYTYEVGGRGYVLVRRVGMRDLTIDQLALLQQLQMAFAEDAPQLS